MVWPGIEPQLQVPYCALLAIYTLVRASLLNPGACLFTFSFISLSKREDFFVCRFAISAGFVSAYSTDWISFNKFLVASCSASLQISR